MSDVKCQMLIHNPVLLNEVLEVLKPAPREFFIDGTVGSGGHLFAILERVGSAGRILGIDWDSEAIQGLKSDVRCLPAEASAQAGQVSGVSLVHGNYADLPIILEERELGRADGLLIDLGLSSVQLEKSGRGFSFQRDEPLDMRYDRKAGVTAAEAVNTFDKRMLEEIFRKFGEERRARKVAEAIVEARQDKKIIMTSDLVRVIEESVGGRKGKIHPATKVFQALRIFVNDELGNLEKILKRLSEIVRPGGRVAIISFHSLEDRMVKNKFRELAKDGKGELINKKPITPSKEEILKNPRSRSAKLRGITLTNN